MNFQFSAVEMPNFNNRNESSIFDGFFNQKIIQGRNIKLFLLREKYSAGRDCKLITGISAKIGAGGRVFR